jgi:hypothetical protein
LLMTFGTTYVLRLQIGEHFLSLLYMYYLSYNIDNAPNLLCV